MKYLVQGDPELIEALAKRLKDNGFKGCAKQGKYLFIDEDTFTITSNVEFVYQENYCRSQRNIPEDWNELKNLTPEPEIKVGQYWKFKDGVFRVCSDHKAKLVAGDYSNTYISWHNNGIKNIAEFIPEDEVEQILIKEAKRRGFDHKIHFDARYKNYKYDFIGNNLRYSPESDGLHDFIHWVYWKGNWAEITEEHIQKRIKDLKNDNLSQYQIGWNNAIDEVIKVMSECKS